MRNPQDHDSIFGDTYHGVPSPTIPHVHPYPTRFHGPIWSYPTFGQPYESNPHARGPSYMGLGSACGGCKGMGTSPDGLGDPAYLSSGSQLVDGILGAVVGRAVGGAFVSKGDEEATNRLVGGVVGLAAGWVGGLLGVAAVGVTGLYLARRK